MKTLILLCALFTATSCISDENSERQANSFYQGNWEGTYTGDDKGTIGFKVDKSAFMSGTYTSSNYNATDNFEGYVETNGQFNCNSRDFSFSGFLNTVIPATGQWNHKIGNTILTGTYTVHLVK